MADGFIVIEQDEATEIPIAFWNGSVLGEAMEDATLLPSKPDARAVSGQLQAQYPERQIAILPARTVIELTTAPRAAVR